MPDMQQTNGQVLSVSEFVALANQILGYALPVVTIRGELANFRVSKNKWVYFDLKDEGASIKFFGTVYQLKGLLENGMLLRVQGTPKLHPLYGFSITVLNFRPEGEGTIRRAAELLLAKLTAEGLFDDARKRQLPYPPLRIGLIASTESAAYADFIKILNARWRGIEIECIDVQVQGDAAPGQIMKAIEYFNQQPDPPEVLVITRGGGSPEDLYAFNTEEVTRTVAASRVPTLVAIGHEVDVSLAELAADRRASTPSNAAELLVPDRVDIERQIRTTSHRIYQAILAVFRVSHERLRHYQSELDRSFAGFVIRARQQLLAYAQLLEALNPRAIMRRGYAIVRLLNGRLLHKRQAVTAGDIVRVEVSNGDFNAKVQ